MTQKSIICGGATGSSRCSRAHAFVGLSLLCALCVLCGECLSQPPLVTRLPPDRPAPNVMPPAPDAVEQTLIASYLTPEQLRDKRVFFGRYTSEDLDTPARVARAALIRGAYDDPALAIDDADADVLDRAEAAYW